MPKKVISGVVSSSIQLLRATIIRDDNDLGRTDNY